MAEKVMQVSGKMMFQRAYDYRTMVEYMGELCVKYPCLELGYIGTSVLDRPIPVITIGQNKHPQNSRGVLYLGGIHGTDLLTPGALLRFVYEYADSLHTGRRMYNVNLPYLFENRTIHVLPMLNPDGYEIRRYGAGDEVVHDRLIKQNGGDDFRGWRGNARGVDLWRNFTDCPERPADDEPICPDGTPGLSPESEPETAALCNYLRIFDDISGVISLHTAGSSIRYFTADRYTPRSRTLARLLSRMTGCTIAPNAETEAGGSLTDWFIRELNKPAFECGCLVDETTDVTDPAQYAKVYTVFREAFFSAPLLF